MPASRGRAFATGENRRLSVQQHADSLAYSRLAHCLTQCLTHCLSGTLVPHLGSNISGGRSAVISSADTMDGRRQTAMR